MDESIDLVALSQAVVADRAPIALRNNRDIELDAAVASLPIEGNFQALTSALANVLDNAIRAEPEGGLIRVIIDPSGRLDIVDHGDGIAPAQRNCDIWRCRTLRRITMTSFSHP